MRKSMHPLILNAISLVFIASMSTPASSFAEEMTAAPNEREPVRELDAIDEAAVQDELPPPAEAPYPGSPELGFEPPASTQESAPPTSLGTARPHPRSTTAAPAPSERPIEVTDDGEYHYSTDLEPPKPSGLPGIPAPLKTTERGEFIYETASETTKFSGQPGIEAPISINARGDFFYPVEHSPTTGTFSLRGGAFSPPKLQNNDNGVTFDDMYGSELAPVVFVDFEWQMTKRFGNLGLKLTSGFFARNANGRFKDPARAAEQTDEEFTFLMLPNQLTAVYKFRYWDTQLFTPYIEGGGGYCTFADLRDDGKSPRFGAAPTAVVAGGLHILLDWLDPQAIRQLDVEWGVNHVWLTLEYRSVVGLDEVYDFSSQVINAGFTMEF